MAKLPGVRRLLGPPKLTYANVVSTLALLLALGGGTALAVKVINADKVDGLNAASLDYRANGTSTSMTFKRVFSQGGLVVRARCYDQSGFVLEARATSRRNNAEIQVSAVSDLGSPEADFALDRDFDRGDVVELPIGVAEQGVHTLVYSTRRGSHVDPDLPERCRLGPRADRRDGLPARRHRAARAVASAGRALAEGLDLRAMPQPPSGTRCASVARAVEKAHRQSSAGQTSSRSHSPESIASRMIPAIRASAASSPAPAGSRLIVQSSFTWTPSDTPASALLSRVIVVGGQGLVVVGEQGFAQGLAQLDHAGEIGGGQLRARADQPSLREPPGKRGGEGHSSWSISASYELTNSRTSSSSPGAPLRSLSST